MKTHLKYAIAGLALLANLSLGNTARAVSVQQPVIGPIAWQRVGAPISMEG
jgi:hypothetical protein